MILEGIVTTTNQDGSTHVAPMGSTVDTEVRWLILRPFRSAVTYANLVQNGDGVFHVVDDVELMARAAIGQLDPLPAMLPCHAVGTHRLADACRWYAFRIASIDETTSTRPSMQAVVVESGRVRDFFGFNRAKHAVLEAAILATRSHILPREEILAEMKKLAQIVNKTGGKQEHAAFALLKRYLEVNQGERNQTEID